MAWTLDDQLHERPVDPETMLTEFRGQAPGAFLREAIAEAHQDFADGSYTETSTPEELRNHLASL